MQTIGMLLLAAATAGDGFGYAVWRPGDGRPYLSGAVTPLG